MSGRTWTTLADGRRVRGYRKTLRQNPRRTPTHEAPTVRVIFQVPAALTLMQPSRRLAVFAEIGPLNNASVTLKSFSRERVFALVADLLREITPKGYPPYSLAAVLTSSSEPNWSDKWRLTYVDGHVTAAKTPIEPLIFPAAAA